MTPHGSTAVTGLELMTALHPPTRACEPDADARRTSAHNPGSLGKDPVDCAPCEAPDGHPLLADLPRFHVRGPAQKLSEEAYDWARPMTDDERTLRHLAGIDVNMAFAAGANGLVVGPGAPTHVKAPVSDPRLPGSWLVDLSHIDLSRVKADKDKWADLDASLLPSVHAEGRAPRGPGLVRHAHRRLRGGAGLQGAADRGVRPVRERPLPGRLVQPAPRRLPRHDGRPRRARGHGAGRHAACC